MGFLKFARGGASMLEGGLDISGNLAPLTIASDEVEGLAGDAYESALDSCGNEGQISIIESMSHDAFLAAAQAAAQGADPYSMLADACPYPDAVSEILEAAADILTEAYTIWQEAVTKVGG